MIFFQLRCFQFQISNKKDCKLSDLTYFSPKASLSKKAAKLEKPITNSHFFFDILLTHCWFIVWLWNLSTMTLIRRMKMKKMTGSILLASVLAIGAIAAPSILAATTAKSTTEVNSTHTKAALDDLRAQVKAGEITHEEAYVQMEGLGFDRAFGKPEHRGHHGKGSFGNIDEETQATIKDIRDQFKAGDLTEVEAQAKLDELAVDLPKDFLTHVDFKVLDEETKVALTEIRDQFGAGDLTEAQAQEKIEALGLDFSAKFLTRGPSHEKLTDEQKAQLDKIREKVEAGTLTEAEARIQMEELGFNPRGGRGEHKHGGPHMKFHQKKSPDSEESQATTTSSEA